MKNTKADNTAAGSSVSKKAADTGQVTRHIQADTASAQSFLLAADKSRLRKNKKEEEDEAQTTDETARARAHDHAQDPSVAESSGVPDLVEPTIHTQLADAGSATASPAGLSPVPSTSPALTDLSFSEAIKANSFNMLKAVGAIAAGALVVHELTRDTTPPTLAITRLSGTGGDSLGETIALEIIFDGPVHGLTNGTDISVFTVAGAGVTATWSGIESTATRTLTYTIAAGQNGPSAINEVALLAALRNGIRDAAGNAFVQTANNGVIPNIDTLALPVIDTPPILSITSDQPIVIAGKTANITFTFSERCTNFTSADITVQGGTLSALTHVGLNDSGQDVYTAIFTPSVNYAGPSGAISVGSVTFTDNAGNANTTGASLNLVVDTVKPQIDIVEGHSTDNTITLSLSENISTTNLPVTTDFQVVQAGRSLQIGSISATGNTLTLHLLDTLQQGSFTLRYDDPGLGDETNALQDSHGNDASNLLRGFVADGYLYGASIFIDTNENGIAEAQEDTGLRTGVDGSFQLTGFDLSKPIIAVGGINTDTGLANMLTMRAPAGSLTINPLTTLVQAMVASDTSNSSTSVKTAHASAVLASALGLPTGTDLSRYDPLSSNSEVALMAQKAAAQVATLAHLVSNSPTEQTALVNALATQMSNNTSRLDLSDTVLITNVLRTAGISGANEENVANALGLLAAANSIDTLAQAQSRQLGLNVTSGEGSAPNVLIGTSQHVITDSDRPQVAFAFSEPIVGFELADVQITNASLSELIALPGGRFFTATLTPNPGASGPITLSLAQGSYQSLAGTPGNASANFTSLSLDNTPPQATLSVQSSSLRAGQTNLVTLNFDEPVAYFDGQQIHASKGTLSAWTQVTSQQYTATFTPTAGNQSTTAIINVAGGAYLDAAGHAGSDVSVNFTVDTRPPVVVISSSKTTLKSGEIATITFTFSEDPGTSFAWDGNTGDIVVVGGNLSAITGSGLVRTATFTPTARLAAGQASITLASGTYSDGAGNAGGASGALGISIDTLAPGLHATTGPQTAFTTITGNAGDSVGEAITLTVRFDGPVNGLTNTTSRNIFTVEGKDVNALWSGSNGTDTRTLTYTVRPGHNGQVQINEAGLKNVLTANIKDAVGNAFSDDGNIANIDSTALPVVETAVQTVAPNQLLSTTVALSPLSGNASGGKSITLTMGFSSAVDGLVSGTDNTVFTVGGHAVTADWAVGNSQTRTLTYTVKAGQSGQVAVNESALSLALLQGIMNLSDVSINAIDGLNGTALPVIDTTGPTLLAAPAVAIKMRTDEAGASQVETIVLTLTFDGPVLGLTSGPNSTVFTLQGTGVNATWGVSDATNTRTLTYTIVTGQSGQAAIDEAALKVSLNAGLVDNSGNKFIYNGSIANIDRSALPIVGPDGATPIDTLAPQLLSISGNAAADSITLTFDEAIDANRTALPGAFRITQGGIALHASSVSVVNEQVTLNGITGLQSGAFTLSYSDTPGDGTDQLQDTQGNDASHFLQGIVADGYIRGALIYIDANNNGQADEDSTGIVTGAGGQFLLPQYTGNGAILAVGGVNTDTNVANTLTLSAPVGSLVINPLTTLIQTLVSANTSSQSATEKIAQASATLVKALGLPPGLDLTTFDPLAAQVDTGLIVQKAAAQVATLLMVATPLMVASDVAASESALVQALATRLKEAAAIDTTVDLSDSSVLLKLLSTLTTPAQAQALSTSLSSTLGAIADAETLAQISAEQSQALDQTAPAALYFQQELLGGLGMGPQLRFDLNVNATDGTAAVSGDKITVKYGAAHTITQTLTANDIAQGKVAVLIDPSLLSQDFSAHLSDAAGKVSVSTERIQIENTRGNYNFDLSDLLSSQLMGLMKQVGKVALPVYGSLESLMQPAVESLMDLLGKLPNLVRQAPQSRMRSMAAPSDDTASVSFLSTDEDVSFLTNLIDDGYNGDLSGGDTSSADSGFILDPPDSSADPFNPSTTPVIPNTTPTDTSPLQPKDFDWTTKTIGFDASTQELTIHVVGETRTFSHATEGTLGGDGFNVALDAELNAKARIDWTFVARVVDQKSTVTDLDSSYLAIDTEASKLTVTLGAGLTEGARASGTLGPLSLTLTDQDSQRANVSELSGTNAPQNTALQGQITLGFMDNDSKPTDGLHVLSADVVNTFIKETVEAVTNPSLQAAEDYYKQWFTAQIDFEGRISGHAQLALDLGTTVPNDSPTTQAVLSFLRTNLDADLTAPISLHYDSTKTDPSEQEYGRIFLDNISTGIQPLLLDKIGPAVQLLDSNLAWLFQFKDLMYNEIPTAIQQPADFAPISLPQWLTNILPGEPGDSNYTDSLQHDIDSAANYPIDTLNGVIDGIWGSMDLDDNGDISNIEMIHSMVLFYYSMINGVEGAWENIKSIPGLKASLASTGYGAVAVSLIEGLVAQKPVVEQVLQGILIIEDTLKAIHNLDQLVTTYDALQTKAQAQAGPQINLGSYVFDFKSGDLQTLDRGLYTNVVDYLYPLPANPEPKLTREQAIERILKHANDNKADEDNMHVHVFLTAGIEGVTPQNVSAMRSMLNADAIDSARLKLNRAGETVRAATDMGNNSDGKTAKDGIQDEVDAYKLLIDLSNGQTFKGKLIATPEQQKVLDQLGTTLYDAAKTDENRYKAVILNAFQALGVVSPDFKPSNQEKARYLNESSTEILYDIVNAQAYRNVDTIDELQDLWDVKNKLEDINLNRYSTDKSTSTEQALTTKDLELLQLPLLGNTDQIKENVDYLKSVVSIYAEPTAVKLYEKLAETVNSLNNSILQNDNNSLSVDSALTVIKSAIANHTARQDLTLNIFRAAGIENVSKATLPMLLEIMDARTDITGWDLDSINVYARAVKTLYGIVNDDPLPPINPSATPYDQGSGRLVTTLLGLPTNDLEIAFWALKKPELETKQISIGDIELLTHILANRTWTEVDTLPELRTIVSAVKEIGAIMSTDPRLYNDNFPVDNTYKDYTPALDSADMAIIGFTGLRDADVTKVVAALKTYLYQEPIAYNGWRVKDPITYDQLRVLVDTNTMTGFMAELLTFGDFKTLWDQLHNAGFAFPGLSNPDFLGKLLSMVIPDRPLEVFDLMTFRPKLPDLTHTVNLEYDFLDGIPGLSLVSSLNMDMGVLPNISMGIDSLGIGKLIKGFTDPNTSFSFMDVVDSFYVADTHLNNGVMEDLPELQVWFDLLAKLEFGIGTKGLLGAFASGSVGADFNFSLDLNDPNSDGKVRTSELVDQTLNLDLFDMDLAINAMLGLAAGLKVDLTPAGGLPKEWNYWTKTAFQAAVATYDYFGGDTDFTLGVDHEWKFPIYNSAPQENSTFIA